MSANKLIPLLVFLIVGCGAQTPTASNLAPVPVSSPSPSPKATPKPADSAEVLASPTPLEEPSDISQVDSKVRELFSSDFKDSLAGEPSLLQDWDSPEGLQMIDDVPFDPSKPTLIYVHGWAPVKQLPVIPNVPGWRKSGFNVMIFRWHKDSYDPGSIPLSAETRVWTKVGEKFVADYKDWFRKYRFYSNEVRVVGHSLGSQPAFYVVYRLFQDKHPQRPARLEFLDPFISGLPIPKEVSQNFVLPEWNGNLFSMSWFRSRTYAILENGLSWLLKQPDAPAIVDYSSIVGGLSAGSLSSVVHFQEMRSAWLEGKKDRQHVLLIGAYMNSIDKPPLAKVEGKDFFPFSANTPTQWLRTTKPFKLIQAKEKKGESFLATFDLWDDRYEVN